MDRLSIASPTQRLELGVNERHSLIPSTAWQSTQTSSQTPALELADPSQGYMSDLPECNMNIPGQLDLPETIQRYNMPYPRPTNLTPESAHQIRSSHTHQRRSPVVTFHCRSIRSCEGHCSCICHSKYPYKSPRLVSKLLGSLFIGYSGLPLSTQQCNLSGCINQTRSIQVSYTFPSWFVWKTLNITAEQSFLNGPCFGLSVKNRINVAAGANIFSFASKGDIPAIVTLLEKRMGSLNDVTSVDGYTPFHVST